MIDGSSGDLKFTSGTTYVCVIDTNLFAGDFERELTGYVFNAPEFGDSVGSDEDFEEALESNPVVFGSIQDNLVSVEHAEYGEIYQDIWATPGRLNNGVGKMYDAAPGETGFPAFESVAVFLERPYTEDELAVITERANAFAETFVNRWNPNQKTQLIIKGIRQLAITVKRSKTITETPV